ncbi:hypothetical protein IW261DRAFT_1513736 [Armillaria novae-zelandiae]|uniref:Uncharacterized protein n=1 Tax=Armillaria novae-zelandiae TaxID=153914 RepID=A0AA39TZS6_9AGAR|nr:hypothetical protein IW261DRAFT_1513736 [Armillaria novae-zelandiae]
MFSVMGLQRETAGRGTTAIYTKVTVAIVFFSSFARSYHWLPCSARIYYDHRKRLLRLPSQLLDGDRNDHNCGFGVVYSGGVHMLSAALLWYNLKQLIIKVSKPERKIALVLTHTLTMRRWWKEFRVA